MEPCFVWIADRSLLSFNTDVAGSVVEPSTDVVGLSNHDKRPIFPPPNENQQQQQVAGEVSNFKRDSRPFQRARQPSWTWLLILAIHHGPALRTTSSRSGKETIVS